METTKHTMTVLEWGKEVDALMSIHKGKHEEIGV
jgi:hypothetical protein